MLRRANDLVARARERIRAAAEHDPHAWPAHHDDRATTTTTPSPSTTTTPSRSTSSASRPTTPTCRPDQRRRPRRPWAAPDRAPPTSSRRAGSAAPRPAAARAARGPRAGGSPAAPATRAMRETAVPNGAAHRRGLVVAADRRAHRPLRPAVRDGLHRRRRRAGHRGADAGRAAAARRRRTWSAAAGRGRWPRSPCSLVGLAVVAGIITLVIERFNAGFADLAEQVSEGIGQVQCFVVRTFPITQGQLDDAVTQIQQTLVDNQDTIASGALTTAATVGEVFTGIVLALFTLFFFLKDGRSIWLWLVGLFPADSRAYVDEAARRSWRTLISYVRATVAVAAGRRDRHRHRPGDPRRPAGHPAGRAGVPRRVHPDHRWLPGRHGGGAGRAGLRTGRSPR